MGSVSGVSGAGGTNYPTGSNDALSQLQQLIEQYLSEPNSQNLWALENGLSQAEKSPNLTSTQKNALNEISTELKKLGSLSNTIAQIQEELSQPGLSSSQKQELENKLYSAEQQQLDIQTNMPLQASLLGNQ